MVYRQVRTHDHGSLHLYNCEAFLPKKLHNWVYARQERSLFFVFVVVVAQKVK